MRLRVGLVLLLLTGLAARLQADETSAGDAWAATQKEAVLRLATLAGGAHAEKLYGCRDEALERLLLLAPDSEAARERLKYKRREGDWVRTRYTRPKNRGSKAAQARHAQALVDWRTWWQEQVSEAHEAAGVAEDWDLQAEIVRTALVLAPDASAVRRLAGEVPHGEGPEARWILADTRRGLENRARFLKDAREATRAVPPPKPGQLEEADRGNRFSWPIVLQGRTVRLVGAVSPEELDRHHEIAEAAAAVFLSVFGIRAELPTSKGRYGHGFCLYAVPGLRLGNAFLATEPGIDARDMEFLSRLAFSHLVKRAGVVVKADDPVHRLEATSHAVQSQFSSPHLNQYENRAGAWAQQAVGLYLAWLQVRTRLLYTVKDARGGRYDAPRPGVPPWERRMGDQAVDWHTLAAEVLASMQTSDLHLTAGKDINNLDSRDLLAGYGLAVFVIEAHPDRSAAFFRDVGSQKRIDLDGVLKKHFHKDLDALRPHLLRWLREMGELAPPAGPVR